VVDRSLRPFMLVALGLTLALVSCSSDSATTPTGGNASQTLSLPPGTYTLDGTIVDCATMNPIQSEHQTVPICVSDPVEDFFGFACPIKRSGNTLSISCDLNNEVTGGCTEFIKIRGDGTASSMTYTLSGTLEFSDNPLGCTDSTRTCWAFDLTFDKVGAAPAGCAYADVGTIALNVAGGSLAGKHVLQALGSGSDSGGGLIQFIFSGSDAPTGTSAVIPAAAAPGWLSLNVHVPPIDPTTLPRTLPLAIVPASARSSIAGAVDTANIYYFEQEGTENFQASAVTSGTLTVNELSVGAIAGTMSMMLTGYRHFTDQPPSQEERTIAGKYFIFNDVENVAQTPTSAGAPGRGIVSGWLAEMMRRARS
jgi:hypothetical protein